MDDGTRIGRCTRCGADVPADAPSGLCPACLIAQALSATETATALAGPTGPGQHSGSATNVTGRLAPGQIFGGYRIEKLLGRGGMGEVYAAEQIEHSRRLALKVLSRGLDDRVDRARFLREGQLAASVNHPQVVYVFGTEDVDGVPVITMELVPAGTLKDRVSRDGPLPAAAAVDAILDVIAGLDAAHAAGVLHRDIKPSNCFVDREGAVKVGDFGLSISTLARESTERTGVFQGTPQFAAPEQLRGEPLDVRADIYAVGATLYYLLTGRPPFDAADVRTLARRVQEEAAPSPHTIRRSVPRGLASIVLQCLAKDKALRPATHASLADALRPYRSSAPTPGTLGRRFIACVIDFLIITIAMMPLAVIGFESGQSAQGVGLALVGGWFPWLYFTVFEGTWGATPGKRCCQLRVRGLDGQKPGVVRAGVRALAFEAPTFMQIGAMALLAPSMTAFDALWGLGLVINLAMYAMMALLFVTVRRANGFAAVHDLLTRTRVVQHQFHEARLVRPPVPVPEAATRRSNPDWVPTK